MFIKMFTIVTLGLCLLVQLSDAALWTYSDGPYRPSNWKKLYTQCDPMLNPRQSPIDINKDRMMYDNELTPLSFDNWDSNPGGTYTIKNNGHTAQVDVPSGMSISGSHLAHGYKLVQFHFHFGSPVTDGSEHAIHGVRYAAEVHFVHINAKYADLKEALDYPDGVLVLGVLLSDKAVEDNTAYDGIFDNLKSIKYNDANNKVGIPAFAVGSLIPPPEQRSKYYHYFGGLTTPDCHGIVSWYVLDETVALSRNQLNKFNTLLSSKKSTVEFVYLKVPMKDTFRPIESIGNRIITASFKLPGVFGFGGPAAGNAGGGPASGAVSVKFGIVSTIIALLTTLLQL